MSGFWDGKPIAKLKGLHVVFTRDHMTESKPGATPKDLIPAKYKLNPARKPKEIDLTYPVGGGTTSLGIYELNSDELKLAIGSHTKAFVRPTSFDPETKPATLLILKRVKTEVK